MAVRADDLALVDLDQEVLQAETWTHWSNRILLRSSDMIKVHDVRRVFDFTVGAWDFLRCPNDLRLDSLIFNRSLTFACSVDLIVRLRMFFRTSAAPCEQPIGARSVHIELARVPIIFAFWTVLGCHPGSITTGMAAQNYDYVIVPALGLDTLTLTGRFKPKRRPLQPPLEFTTVEEDLHSFPQAVLVLIPEG